MPSNFDRINGTLKEIKKIRELIVQGYCRPEESDRAVDLAENSAGLITDEILKRKAEKLKEKYAFKNIRKSAPFVSEKEARKLDDWIVLLEECQDKRKIKSEISSEKIHVQSVVDGKDQHIFITEKGSSEHSHLILDGNTGEIRIDSKDQSPHGLVKSIQAQLELKTGETIQITKSKLSFIEPESPRPDVMAYAASKDGYFVIEIYNNGDEDLDSFKVVANWTQPLPHGPQERVLEKFNDGTDYLVMAHPRSLNLLKQGSRVYVNGVPTISTDKKIKISISCRGMKTGIMVKKVFELETPKQY